MLCEVNTPLRNATIARYDTAAAQFAALCTRRISQQQQLKRTHTHIRKRQAQTYRSRVPYYDINTTLLVDEIVTRTIFHALTFSEANMIQRGAVTCMSSSQPPANPARRSPATMYGLRCMVFHTNAER